MRRIAGLPSSARFPQRTWSTLAARCHPPMPDLTRTRPDLLRCPDGHARRRPVSRPACWRPAASPGPGAHRRAEDRHHVPAAGDVEQPGRARGPGGGAAGPSSAGPLPCQPGPAGDREAGRRPGGILDRRVGDPGPSGPAGAAGRGHLPRAVLGRGRAAGRAGRPLPPACRGTRRADRAGHGVAAARGVAGDGQAPQRPGLGGLAGGRDRHGNRSIRTGASGGSGVSTTPWPSWICGPVTCRRTGST